MKKILLTLLFIIALSAVKAQVSFGKSKLFNDGWQFYLGAEPGEKSRWQSVDLPHDWSVKQRLSPTLASAQGYLPGGIGWYRKTLTLSNFTPSEMYYLYFEGVYNRSEVFVNGQLVGKRPNGYISFLYDVTPYLKAGDNQIEVKVDHSRQADSRWYTGSGIYRNVWLVTANQVHIAQWGIYAVSSVDKKQGILGVEIALENNTDSNRKLQIINELIDSSGKTVATHTGKTDIGGKVKNQSVKIQLKVKNPLLWDLDNPNLYTLKTRILENGKVIDETTTTTGFRTFTFDPDKGFFLNGKNLKMKGVCIHHDAGVLGSAVPKSVWKRRLLNLKEIGVNAIRTSHNPQSSDLYALADELGLLVLDEAYDEWEFPKRKWLEGWNVGTPGFEGSYDFFAEWGETDLSDMVRRDRNHLSIFAYSIGNEVDYPNDPYSHPVLAGGEGTGFTQAVFGGYKPDAPNAERLGGIAKKLAAAVKKYDASRPVTAGLAGVAMSNNTEYPFVLDITGYNYTESRYAEDHVKYPKRVLFGSENRHDLPAWKAVTDNDYVFGQFLWTGIDYLGESGRYPSRGFYSGLLDFGGFIKPRGYFRQSLWSSKPMIYMGTYPTPGKNARNSMNDVFSQTNAETNYVERTPSMDAWSIWNYNDNQMIRVVVYTNAAKAKLLLDGKEIGETKNYNPETGIIFWDVPYRAGKLEAIGLDASDRETARYAIQSSGRPYALKVVRAEKSVEKEDVAQIVVQVVDENGVPVMLSDDEITCSVSNNAKLLGLEASNNEDMGDYTDNRQRAFHGRLLAYVKAREAGTVKVKFTSVWLQGTETEIDVK
ncbi:MAG: DUF4982 domain-containing protein [Tannerella sp.]|jgi:hypothetical protein|nr:DUF4982 domain-containing protein [Tannerella sp.]